MLKKLVIQQIAAYFRSEQWNKTIETLEKGRKIRHMHVYANSILYPHDMAKVVEGYFSKKGYTLQRKIGFLGHGKGITNIYYIHPRQDMAHFELFLTYDSNAVIEPANPNNTRAGTNLEYWEDDFMENYYSKYEFRQPETHEKPIISSYFKSQHWQQSYEFMTSEGTHCHVPVKTSIHPETLAQFGRDAIEAKGWSISKVDSVVYSMKGYDQGKITYLLSSPEMVLELDWEFDADTVIEPRHPELIIKMTEENFKSSVEGLSYYRLDHNDIREVIDLI
ncbi:MULTISPECIES: hypothetical protein [unclassified Paenibacillus]|uniref:hypothetical protein n=1 Tax=unclassified Paenibacillus TaxID=185978 RepID=UPI001AE46126|nr:MULTISPECIES: hypothetical protein [unclassified Paenibacillus]MBP1155763.1 hypothetical protein [Paenibacillus sp. PvP091]MBP1168851.1 hypothetical protein [Paenibacillus sp. PvR098]MBP2439879.1 hypothetical protein [Paenibacillus sp. PvP052]